MYGDPDKVLWDYATENELIIVSKEYDFQQMQIEKGSPPSVVKLSIGNCTNERIKQVFTENAADIKNRSYQYGLIIIG